MFQSDPTWIDDRWNEPLLSFFDESSNRFVDEVTLETALSEVVILVVDRLDASWDDPALVSCSTTDPARFWNLEGPSIHDHDCTVSATYCSP